MNHCFSSAMEGITQQEQKNSMVGFRFHPTDYELINWFLRRKVSGNYKNHTLIPDIKVCDFEPWELRDQVNANSEDQVWYFFCPKDYKYLRSNRSNRTTKIGYWKPTGKPRKVKDKTKKKEIGTKRSLVFYIKKRPKDIRTKWIIHEYDIQENFVLCKLKDKTDVEKTKTGEASNVTSPSNSTCNEYETSFPMVLDWEKNPSQDMTAIPNYINNETDISVSEKGGWCLQFSDFENQNQHENTDISTSSAAMFNIESNTSETSTTPIEVNSVGANFSSELEKLPELDETTMNLWIQTLLGQPMSPTESSSNDSVFGEVGYEYEVGVGP